MILASASSDVSGRGKKMSTTSFGSSVVPGGDYFSTTLERRLSKDKSEALGMYTFGNHETNSYFMLKIYMQMRMCLKMIIK